MEDLIEIGKITKPQGLKGELKVQLLSNNLERFLGYQYIYLGQDRAKKNIRNSRLQGGFAYIFIDDINTIDDAEKLRNQLIFIDKSQLPELEDGEFFISDLIGCKVCDESGLELGIITDVDNFGVADTITMKNIETKKEILFPFLDRVIKSVDVANSVIIVNSQAFDEVKVDEN